MSLDPFAGLEPDAVWRHFADFVRTPRPSKHEEKILAHLAQWAQARGLEHRSDAAGNLAVYVPGRGNRATAPTVCLQSHVDIVVANSPEHVGQWDAATGKIKVVRAQYDEATHQWQESPTGNTLLAPYTTLGADNGVGCAMMCALAEDDSAIHPPLVLLFTVDEEQGLTGAARVDPALLRNAKALINIDTEDDDQLCVGCAGGRDVRLRWERPRAGVPAGWSTLTVRCQGGKGGHSGIEIHAGRSNAHRLVARALRAAMDDELPVRIIRWNGGEARNAIPRNSTALVAVHSEQRSAVMAAVARVAAGIRPLYAGRDEAASLSATADDAPASEAFGGQHSSQLVDLVLAIPSGVQAITPESPKLLVETSNNLALIETDHAHVEIGCNCRSSSLAGMEDVTDLLSAVARNCGAALSVEGTYPGWKPNFSSPLLKTVQSTYERMFGAAPVVEAIHAGLECGVVVDKSPGMDAISIGPTIRGNHSPGERVYIASVAKSWRLLREVLTRL